MLYAPLSNVGAVSFDKDAVYIDIGRANFTKKENLAITDGNVDDEDEESDSESDEDPDAPAALLKSLQDVQSGVDEKMKKSTLRLFKTSKAVRADDTDESDSNDDNDDEHKEGKKKMSIQEMKKLVEPFRRKASLKFNDGSESDGDESEDESLESSDEGSESEDKEEDYDDEDSIGNDEQLDTGVGTVSASWKQNLAQKAAEAYLGRDSEYLNLQELVYGKAKSNIVSDEDDQDDNSQKDDNDSDSDEEFFKLKTKGNNSSYGNGQTQLDTRVSHSLGEEDSSRAVLGNASTFDVSTWLEEGDECLIESIRDKFVTGNWENPDSIPQGGDDTAFGDFEDLETGEAFGPNGEINSDDEEENDELIDTEGMTDAELRELNSKKKASKKATFDEEYDEEKKGAISSTNPADENAEKEYIDSLKREKEARLKRNIEEFGADGESSRLRLEGFRQGLYCRIRIDGVPAEFVECFDPQKPVILGGLTPQETNRGYIRCRFKKHRWHKRILKCNDPLIFSVGWRRFQSIPVFSTEDDSKRHRYVWKNDIFLIVLSILNLTFSHFNSLTGISSIHQSTCIVMQPSMGIKYHPTLVY